jgi:hypothetical protein
LKICSIPKVPRKYSISENNSFVPIEEINNTEEKRKNQEGNKAKEQGKTESVNSPNTSGLQSEKMYKNNSLKKLFIIMRRLKTDKDAVSAWKITCQKLRKMTGSNVSVAESGCTSSVLYTKTKVSTAVESHCERKAAK